MPHHELLRNWDRFCQLLDQVPKHQQTQIQILCQYYVEHHVILINDLLSVSITQLEKLGNLTTAADVIYSFETFSRELNKKLTFSTKQFLHKSLENIAHYNAWLKDNTEFVVN
ncbi:MAG TPA: hypothetical protein VNC84_03385 [Gammaproteobacteria bacterium]|jgi:hypothetical protein|nr:hypothetical protein [Gammaproteobacteria bacterium]